MNYLKTFYEKYNAVQKFSNMITKQRVKSEALDKVFCQMCTKFYDIIMMMLKR